MALLSVNPITGDIRITANDHAIILSGINFISRKLPQTYSGIG